MGGKRRWVGLRLRVDEVEGYWGGEDGWRVEAGWGVEVGWVWRLVGCGGWLGVEAGG